MQALSQSYDVSTLTEVIWEIAGCVSLEDMLIYEKWIENLRVTGKIPNEGLSRLESVVKRRKLYIQTKAVVCQ